MLHVLPRSPGRPDVGALRPAESFRKRSPTTVVVTEQEVVFSSAAALSLPPTVTRRRRLNERLIAAIGRMLTPLPEPRRHYPPREPNYFEAARMSREMDRL